MSGAKLLQKGWFLHGNSYPKYCTFYFFTPQAYRVILYTEPQIKRFVRFVRLLPFGQWVFDKSHVQKKWGAFSCKIRLKTPLSCQGTIKIKRKSKDKSKEKIKKRIREKTPLHRWYSVSVFWFKLCSRRLTERNAAILSSYNIYIIGIWIYISLAIIRPVSLRLQNEGQKRLTDCTRSLWHGFFDLCFLIYIWI